MNHSIFVGIDVAKHHHDAYIFDSKTGEVITEHFKFNNDSGGFESLVTLINQFPNNSVLIGVEAT
ncbi:IS110 family transposase [Culicoidibacter larvae]|uniref:IS110 family transposase n=1 Tax=Culicoidibacter larvae TaxID=2579976 RepID=A0A5R8QFM9_9FIRM|nr:IS110 family transposase [Culicoidibacter larvae]